MAKFIGYVRVSTADQGKQGHGLDAQKAAIAAYIDRTRSGMSGASGFIGAIYQC